ADDLRFLAARDSDPFNRWQVVQTLATRLLTDNVAALRSGGPTRTDRGLLHALGAILDDTLENAFVALALTLPGEADLAREIGRDVDPDAIFAARTALRAEIGRHLAGALAGRYAGLTDTTAPYRPDAEGAGRRALRSTCLDLMVAARLPDA